MSLYIYFSWKQTRGITILWSKSKIKRIFQNHWHIRRANAMLTINRKQSRRLVKGIDMQIRKFDIQEMARTLGLAIWFLRPNLPDFPQIPRLLATRIDNITFCLVPSMATSQARRRSMSSALDLAISRNYCNFSAIETLVLTRRGKKKTRRKMKMKQKIDSLFVTSLL